MKSLAMLLLTLLFAAVATVSVTVVPGLRRVLRGMVLGLAALLLAAAAGIGLTGWSSDSWWAVGLAGVIGLVGLRLLLALRRSRRRIVAHEPAMPHAQLSVPDTVPEPHWSAFERQFDWVGRQQVRAARRAIAGFLAERDSPELTADHQHLLLRLDKRVPELIAACLERCRGADHKERHRYLDETLARLQRIGDDAEQARVEVRAAGDRRLETLHRYFDSTSGKARPGAPGAPGAPGDGDSRP